MFASFVGIGGVVRKFGGPDARRNAPPHAFHFRRSDVHHSRSTSEFHASEAEGASPTAAHARFKPKSGGFERQRYRNAVLRGARICDVSQEDGINTADWLKALSNLTAGACKKFSHHMGITSLCQVRRLAFFTLQGPRSAAIIRLSSQSVTSV